VFCEEACRLNCYRILAADCGQHGGLKHGVSSSAWSALPLISRHVVRLTAAATAAATWCASCSALCMIEMKKFRAVIVPIPNSAVYCFLLIWPCPRAFALPSVLKTNPFRPLCWLFPAQPYNDPRICVCAPMRSRSSSGCMRWATRRFVLFVFILYFPFFLFSRESPTATQKPVSRLITVAYSIVPTASVYAY
jgi:hypothetical protein